MSTGATRQAALCRTECGVCVPLAMAPSRGSAFGLVGTGS